MDPIVVASSTRTRLAGLLCTAVLGLLPGAHAQQPARQAQVPASAAAGHAAMGHGSDMKTSMQGMGDRMSATAMTGDPDVDFAAMMRIHHQGALDMAQAYLRDGKDAAMRRMARDIIASQNKEIAQFDKFLAARGHAHGAKGK